jgi:hypothetical protein
MWMKHHKIKQEGQLKENFRPERALHTWKLETVNPDLHGAGFWRGLVGIISLPSAPDCKILFRLLSSFAFCKVMQRLARFGVFAQLIAHNSVHRLRPIALQRSFLCSTGICLFW